MGPQLSLAAGRFQPVCCPHDSPWATGAKFWTDSPRQGSGRRSMLAAKLHPAALELLSASPSSRFRKLGTAWALLSQPCGKLASPLAA